MARVDDQAYSLMSIKSPGDSINPAIVRTAEYTATHSVFTLSAGPVNFTLDFFSPISPSNYLRQSLLFNLLQYRWKMGWETAEHGLQLPSRGLHSRLCAQNAVLYTEESDMATWGEAILGSRPTPQSNLSFTSGHLGEVLSQLVRHGKLPSHDASWMPGGIIAFAHDLGTVSGDHSVNFAVGYVRTEAIDYLGKPYTGYYRSRYKNTYKALSYFRDDYSDALHESFILDSEMVAQATAVAGQKYADIVTLSARQAYGAIDLTVPNDSLDKEDVLAFVKELSSNGNLNTVDVIMPAFPIYYIMDPDYIRLLLEPMMRYLAAGRWHQPYVIHDMGVHYPKAIGHDNQIAEPMPIEECGNLMVLILAYICGYLVENSIDIARQLSSNDAAGALANEINQAIKAAVGLKAFGELSGLSKYSRIGDARAHLFFHQGLGTDGGKSHFVLQYPGKHTSGKIPYNLYPEVLFDLKTFPEAAHQMGNQFFKSVRAEYGVPLDHRKDWAKSDWNMWLAATFDDLSTRDEFVDDLWAFMSNGKHNWPFSDRYVSTSAQGRTPGKPVLCRARPTVGGHFSLVALQGPRCLQTAVLRKLEAGDVPGQTFFGQRRQDL